MEARNDAPDQMSPVELVVEGHCIRRAQMHLCFAVHIPDAVAGAGQAVLHSLAAGAGRPEQRVAVGQRAVARTATVAVYTERAASARALHRLLPVL